MTIANEAEARRAEIACQHHSIGYTAFAGHWCKECDTKLNVVPEAELSRLTAELSRLTNVNACLLEDTVLMGVARDTYAAEVTSLTAALAAREEKARDQRQATVANWCAAAFGIDQAASITQRGIRLLEEAIEAYQATGANAEMAHKMVNYIFSRPSGTIAQELGGVGVTALALANAAGLSADRCEADEVARVLAKPLAHFTARNQAKNDAGFRALAARPTPADSGEG